MPTGVAEKQPPTEAEQKRQNRRSTDKRGTRQRWDTAREPAGLPVGGPGRRAGPCHSGTRRSASPTPMGTRAAGAGAAARPRLQRSSRGTVTTVAFSRVPPRGGRYGIILGMLAEAW